MQSLGYIFILAQFFSYSVSTPGKTLILTDILLMFDGIYNLLSGVSSCKDEDIFHAVQHLMFVLNIKKAPQSV